MSLDFSKLKSVQWDGEKTIAQCPACAAEGHDSTEDHLAIYPDGKFGCVVHPKDKEHNREIFRLAGNHDSFQRGPVPMRIKRPPCATAKPRTLLVLDWLVAPRRADLSDSQPGEAGQAQVTDQDTPPGSAGCERLPPQKDALGSEQGHIRENPFGCRVPSMASSGRCTSERGAGISDGSDG